MSTAGYVVAAVVTLVLGYLVPSLVRRRQAFGDARVPDRFSDSLRVVERRTRGGAATSTMAILPGAAPTLRPPPSARGSIAPAQEFPVNRPTGMAERRSAEQARKLAAVRAAVAARRAEQAAAARRRLVITLGLALVSAVAWLAVAQAGFPILLAVFPTAVLALVLWLGVRAARAEREEWDAVPESLRTARPVASGGPSYSAAQLREYLAPEGAAVAATTAEAAEQAGASGLRWSTEASVFDGEMGESEASNASVDAGDGTTWTPVPVPVPTYTLKAPAVRAQSPLVLAEEEADDGERASAAEVAVAEVPGPGEVVGIDLNAVLARRRGA